MKKILKSIGAFSIGPFATAALGLIIVPLTTHFISPEEYGRSNMFVLAQGLISMFVYLGMDQAYIREYNQVTDKKRLLYNALTVPLVTSVVLGLLIIVLSEWVSQILFDVRTEYVAVYLMALAFPFMVISRFALNQARMDERGLLYSAFSIILKVFVLIFTLALFFVYERSFRSVVYALALAEIVEGIILYFIVLRGYHPFSARMDKELTGRMLKFGIPLLPANIMSWILSSVDQVMLRTLCTYTELGLYTAAHKIVSALGIIQTCFTTIWTPVCFRWYEQKKSQEWFGLVMKLVSAMMCVLCFGALLCKDILAWLLGAEFAQAIAVFPFLLLNPIMYTMSETTIMGVYFSRKTQYNIVVSIVSGGTSILVNLLLTPYLGGIGAAMATGISYVVFFWVRTLISRKLWWKFPLGGFVVYTLLAILNCAAHSFIEGFLPYALSAICIVLVALAAIPQIQKALRIIKTAE